MGRGLTSGLTGRSDQSPGLQTQDLGANQVLEDLAALHRQSNGGKNGTPLTHAKLAPSPNHSTTHAMVQTTHGMSRE